MEMDMAKKAEAAANSLRVRADVLLQTLNDLAPLQEMAGNKATEAVVESWFQDQNNVNKVEAKTGKSFKKSLHSRLEKSIPMLYTNCSKPGKIKPPFAKKHVVLIALENLDIHNGLSKWIDAPDRLSQGEWVLFSGDEEHLFPAEGGGLSIFIILDKATEDGS